jgi:hypothetical protein
MARIIGGISHATIYTLLDDYIKSVMSSGRDFESVVNRQFISILIVFFPLLFASNELLTRRISNMLLGAGIIVGFGGSLRLFEELKVDARSAFRS